MNHWMCCSTRTNVELKLQGILFKQFIDLWSSTRTNVELKQVQSFGLIVHICGQFYPHQCGIETCAKISFFTNSSQGLFYPHQCGIETCNSTSNAMRRLSCFYPHQCGIETVYLPSQTNPFCSLLPAPMWN